MVVAITLHRESRRAGGSGCALMGADMMAGAMTSACGPGATCVVAAPPRSSASATDTGASTPPSGPCTRPVPLLGRALLQLPPAPRA